MRQSLMQWHLSRDNCVQLYRFCAKHAVRTSKELNTYEDEHGRYWQMTFTFNNGGYITAELKHGDSRSYTVADHFQVVDYGWGV